MCVCVPAIWAISTWKKHRSWPPGNRGSEELEENVWYFSFRNSFWKSHYLLLLLLCEQVVNTYTPGKKIWLEGVVTTSAGGTNNLSDSYAAGFLWVELAISLPRALRKGQWKCLLFCPLDGVVVCFLLKILHPFLCKCV